MLPFNFNILFASDPTLTYWNAGQAEEILYDFENPDFEFPDNPENVIDLDCLDLEEDSGFLWCDKWVWEHPYPRWCQFVASVDMSDAAHAQAVQCKYIEGEWLAIVFHIPVE